MRCGSHATGCTSYMSSTAALTGAGRGHDALFLGCKRLLVRLLPPLPHLLLLQLPHFLHAASACVQKVTQQASTWYADVSWQHLANSSGCEGRLAPLLPVGMQQAAAALHHQQPAAPTRIQALTSSSSAARCSAAARCCSIPPTTPCRQGRWPAGSLSLSRPSILAAAYMLCTCLPLARRAYLQRRDEACPVDGRLCHELVLH